MQARKSAYAAIAQSKCCELTVTDIYIYIYTDIYIYIYIREMTGR